MTLQERLRQMASFHETRACQGGERHLTWADESRQAADVIDRFELALHRIVGHGNITVEKAKAVAAEALEKQS